MEVGELVVRKSYGRDITFKIIEVKKEQEKTVYMLKGINLRLIADSPAQDLEVVRGSYKAEIDEIFNRKVNSAIKKIIGGRDDYFRGKKINDNEMSFGRPGKVLHLDGDAEYVEVCMKVYKQLGLDAVGEVIPEQEQPNYIVDLVRLVKPDIVVLTGHDSMNKDIDDYADLNNYRNSKYFAEAVKNLRNLEPSYDDLVVFAGACQSCYEKILDAGANFASSPNRVLIHCLDPVFICEKIAFTNIEKVVSIQDVLRNTITGTKGIGGLQTRGKYRLGYPKSIYI